MTSLLGNRLSICPLRFRMASPRVPIDLGCASVNGNSWGGDPESLGPNRSAYYPRVQSLFVYYWSGIFSGKTEKMAVGCDSFSVIFGIYSQNVLSIIVL